jgi:hypothetical protein
MFLLALFSRWVGIDYANQPISATLLVDGGLVLGANALIQFWPQEKA